MTARAPGGRPSLARLGWMACLLIVGFVAGTNQSVAAEESVCRFLPVGVAGATIDVGTQIDDGAECRADLIIGERGSSSFAGIFTVDITTALSFDVYYDSVAAAGMPTAVGHIGAFTDELISTEFSHSEVYIVFCRGDWVGHVFHAYDNSAGAPDTKSIADEMASEIDMLFAAEGAAGCADGSAAAGDQSATGQSSTGQPVAQDGSTDGDDGGGVPWTLILVGGAVAAGAGVAVRRGRRPGGAKPPDETDEDDQTQVTLELTYPAGQSPYVFEDGWVFGARCIVDGPSGQRDISDRVKWSGSATFDPAVGELSRPRFRCKEGSPLRPGVRSTGTITLTVEVDGEITEETYPIAVISPYGYAAVDDRAYCESDAHGCPTCPHQTTGPITSGSPNVLVDGKPAARVGDGGPHASCCGPNTFIITSGDPNVLINGKHAAVKGSATEHCGGVGTIITGWGVV